MLREKSRRKCVEMNYFRRWTVRIITICPDRANTLMEDKVAGRKFAVLSTYRDI